LVAALEGLYYRSNVSCINKWESGKEQHHSVLVLFILGCPQNNSSTIVFEALTEEGSRIPPRKLDGKLHFDGDIVVADKAAVISIMRICRPALNATDDIPTAFIGAPAAATTLSTWRIGIHLVLWPR
jgi:hypothetical protein